MRIKHFAGYGTVNAKKLSERRYKYYISDDMGVYDDGHCKQIMVKVWGDHERGLERPFKDCYCIHGWLGTRFAKGKDYKDLIDYQIVDNGNTYDEHGHFNGEYAVYSLIYKEEQ